MHDLEHPGLNNLYQINAGTQLAIRYNDISVLENHHCAKAFELLAQPECNVLVPFTAEHRKYLRRAIIAMVLATDMSVHFSLKDELDKLVVGVREGSIIVAGSNDKEASAPTLPAPSNGQGAHSLCSSYAIVLSLHCFSCCCYCCDTLLYMDS